MYIEIMTCKIDACDSWEVHIQISENKQISTCIACYRAQISFHPVLCLIHPQELRFSLLRSEN